MVDVGRYPDSHTTIGRIIRAPLRLIPEQAVLPILQGPLRGKRWIAGSGIHRLWLGSYEPSKMAFAAQWVDSGETVFDIGANVGIYTLLFSERVGTTGRVIAFEPSPRNVIYLRRHLHLNRVSNSVVVEAAVCESTGTAQFDLGPDCSGGYLAPTGSLRIATTTLDDYVESTGYGPSLLKIDVEGAELEVLRGALNTLSSSRPRILVATHSASLKQGCIDLLMRAGYRVEELVDGSHTFSDELVAQFGPAAPCDSSRIEPGDAEGV